MSEVAALKQLTKVAKPKPVLNVTAKGKVVDISKGFKVRGPDGTAIPFKSNTPLSKAKEWTKNFYNKDFEEKLLSKTEEGEDPDGAVEQISLTTKRQTMEQRDEGKFPTSAGEVMYLKTEDEYQIKHSYVPAEERGKGIAAGMYRHIFEKAKKDGRTVVSDSRLSAEAVAIWQRFKELGYPVIEHPMTPRGGDFIRAGAKREDDLPLFEYDPLAGEDIKPQAGQTPADRKGPKTDMMIESQAGDRERHLERGFKMNKIDPGLYFDEDSKQYVQVGEDGNITPVDVNEAR